MPKKKVVTKEEYIADIRAHATAIHSFNCRVAELTRLLQTPTDYNGSTLAALDAFAALCKPVEARLKDLRTLVIARGKTYVDEQEAATKAVLEREAQVAFDRFRAQREALKAGKPALIKKITDEAAE